MLAGLSAGAMCWIEGGVTKSAGPPEPIDGLGFLGRSLSVHADGEPERLPVWLEAVRAGPLPGGWAADDGVGLLFRGQRSSASCELRPGAAALRADAVDGELVRRRLEPELLGVGGRHRRAGCDEDVRELRRVARVREGHGARPWR